MFACGPSCLPRRTLATENVVYNGRMDTASTTTSPDAGTGAAAPDAAIANPLKGHLGDVGNFAKMDIGDWVILFAFVAITILLCAFFSHLARRAIVKLFGRQSSYMQNVTIFVNIARFLIWFIGACIVLTSCFNVNVSALLAALGIGGIALSLGMQDTLSNFIGGLQISTMRVVNVGDFVRCGSIEGIVADITWRHTRINGFRGEFSVIPNSVVNSTPLTVLPAARRVKVRLTVPYETAGVYRESSKGIDVACDRIAQSIRDALCNPAPQGMGLTLDSDPIVLLQNTGEYAIFGDAIVWVSEGCEHDRVRVEDAIVRAASATISEGFAH